MESLAIAHTILDQGRDYCPHCEVVVEAGKYCGECGRDLFEGEPKRRQCKNEKCVGYSGPARYCPNCGDRLRAELAEKFDKGQASVADEAARLMAIIRSEGVPRHLGDADTMAQVRKADAALKDRAARRDAERRKLRGG